MPSLSSLQQETANKIIQVGRDLGKNDTQIMTALKVAYIESSLGENKGKNPNSSAKGLYQYLDGSWPSHEGERYNDEDSIKAFYKDMQAYDNRYAKHRQLKDNDVPSDVTRDEYIYIKHHDGTNAAGDSFNRDDNMDKGINIYDKRSGDANSIATDVMKNYQGYQANPEPTEQKVSNTVIQKPISQEWQKDSTQASRVSILDYLRQGLSKIEGDYN